MDLLGQGWSEEQILESYPGITREDVLACLRHASDILNSERVYPISASTVRILASENFPRPAVVGLRKRGHDKDDRGPGKLSRLVRAIRRGRRASDAYAKVAAAQDKRVDLTEKAAVSISASGIPGIPERLPAFARAQAKAGTWARFLTM